MKKTLALVLSVLMVIAALAVFTINASADDETFIWDEENTTITVLKDVTGDFNSGEGIDTFPWADYRGEVTKVIFSDDVTTVAKCAFSSCAYLEEVVTGIRTTRIEMDAFAYNACLNTITFGCPIKYVGQGTVYLSTNIISVTLTNQTKEEFLAVATKLPYNTAYEDEFISYTVNTVDLPDEPEPPKQYKALTIKPYYGVLENWNGGTFFIVGGTDAEFANREDLVPTTDEEGNVTAPAKITMKVVIVDETENKTYTIPQYAFDTPTKEIYADGSFVRVAPTYYGIVPSADHAYTITLEFYEAGKLIASGTSEQGAFNKANDAFNADGPIIPDPVPHSYAEAGGQNPDNPPVVEPTGDNTAVIAVLAIVALLGTAVVVSKKVFSK